MKTNTQDKTLGIALAVFATIIWSGNFVVARGIITQIGPVSLAFYRWLTATLIIAPIAWKKFRAEKAEVKKHIRYLFWSGLTGVSIFNTCVYIAGHFTSAINLALIGTTSSPIFATLLAALFWKDKPGLFRITGMLICLAGILLLISKGSWQLLSSFRFSSGDLWVLTGSFSFAIYSNLVRKKPATLSSINFLFVVFAIGTLLLCPFFAAECLTGTTATVWNWQMAAVILYLGAGASVAAFLCWNLSIQKIGAGRTVLFGNLIPLFSVLEAVGLLGEQIAQIHLYSGALVVAGLILANTTQAKMKAP